MSKPVLRCAIYTRVSSDQGLEQDFNSLDAQREAAEAYVKSQVHEGWKLLRDYFDDGGYSGGSMERPALQRLMKFVKAERIDVIVVCKVDRLTRSLADFAKLVELFDAHKVSFVSVTQSFNTTTSMGRLTPNVLLSFAQFEREVTGERIRDKIEASKKKGLWMGGVVPMGYRVEDRKLVVDEEEAKVVRRIFERYLALSSIPALQRELRESGVVTRSRKMANGKTIGAVSLTNGPLSYILKNRHYLGEINHKGRSWPGEHAPIIDADLFEAVQARLKKNLNRTASQKSQSGALLIGKIFDDRGNPMSPSHAVKKGVRYRYYVSAPIAQGRKDEAGSVARVPAEPIEQLVLGALRRARGCDREGSASAELDSAGPFDRECVVNDLDRVILRAARVDILLSRTEDEDVGAEAKSFSIPWTKPSPVRRREIILPEMSAATSQIRPIRMEERARLLKAIAVARRWLDELIAGTITEVATIAAREQKTERSVRMTLSLAFLDPVIIKAAVEGKLPRGYGVSRLVDLPPAFSDQWTALGITRPRHSGVVADSAFLWSGSFAGRQPARP